MTWFTDRRMEWIDETVRIFGFINRGHITKKFGVSTQQASADLTAYQRRYPGKILYDTSAKRFVAARVKV